MSRRMLLVGGAGFIGTHLARRLARAPAGVRPRAPGSLHEFERIKRDFTANDLFGALSAFKPVRIVTKTLVGSNRAPPGRDRLRSCLD